MNILFFSRYFYPHIGGVEKHVLEVSRELCKQGHGVTVICEMSEFEEKNIRLEEEFEGIKILRIPVGGNQFLKKFTIWWWLFHHKKLISQPDVIHAHDVFYWWIPFLLLSPKKKVYTTFHGYEGNNIPGKRAIFMHRLAAKYSKGTIAIGVFFEKWYGTKSDVVLYGGVEKKLFSVKKRITNNEEPYKLVFIGRLEEETGIMMYLKALKLLQKKYAVTLQILGDGSLKKHCEQFISSNNLYAQIIGFVPNIENYLKKADIAFVSRYLSILEAFALKKYVVAEYNNEIKKDYLTMTPFAKNITICFSAEEIAGAIEKYMCDKKTIERKISSAFFWVESQTWENIVKSYLSLWK